ncbi:DNA polymerase III subunit alpha [Bacillus sp. FSL W8-0223]|uniref:DNA polymerase III subunit alpha n=1 Tax=Bacillus sp. FSL W8-0223 TaxID=2954595 RepID=UPI0030F8CE8D
MEKEAGNRSERRDKLLFAHLQIKTGYSLLSSTIMPDKLAEYGKKLGLKALALTDHNVMYAAVPFYKACKANGIKPIIGLTADIQSPIGQGRSFPLVLLAKHNTGYQNLLKISSLIQTKSPQGLPIKWLKAYSKGLFAFTPGMEGEIEQLILNGEFEKAGQVAHVFKNIFEQESFYFSLQDHLLSQEEEIRAGLTALSKEMEISCIVTHDVQYLDKGDSFSHECLLAIRDGAKLADENRKTLATDEYDLKPPAEMYKRFSGYPDALENTLKIVEQCTVEIHFHQQLLPKYPLPDNENAKEVLYRLCMQGLEKKGKKEDPHYLERLSYELAVIDKMGFNDYFLIVWDFMKFARSQAILTGPGRGSAAGSLVAYLLEITDIDPLKYGLLFERFLNPERVTMPDIDLDFPDHRRDEVIRYVAKKYGNIHVAQIITFGTLSAKAVIRDIARVFGFQTKELDRISKMLPSRLGLTLLDAYKDSSMLRTWVESDPVHKQIFETALKLEGLPRHASTHAAGVVITEQPLVELIPIQQGHDEMYMTQFTMDILEELGLLKIDFLGLRNLTILERILESIQYSSGEKMELSEIPLNDRKTFELLGKGQTTGVFQLESEGMRKVLMRLKPSDFEDIVAVNALYRPGPMENIPLYIERKHGLKKIAYPHPDLEGILKQTYGVLIYQEQIMQIASKMAGFSLGEADLLRRAVGKKKKEVLAEERKHFIEGAVRNGYSKETADQIYDLIVRFANYGFNRSHAVAYSKIAYQLAYLKAHYPLYFMAALLTSVIGSEKKIAQYVREAKEMGIQILRPSIQSSQFFFKAEKEGIRFGLAAIKGVGAAAVKEILRARKEKMFEDLFDFCLRVSPQAVNRRTIESLILAGAFDDFGKDRATLLASVDAAIDHAEFMRPDPDENGHFELFADESFFPKPKYTEVEPMPDDMRLKYEKEVLGLYLSSHPVSVHKSLFQKLGVVDIAYLKSQRKKMIIGVYIHEFRVIRTKKGEKMAFLSISDESGEMEAVLFPEIYRKFFGICEKGTVVLMEGTNEERNGNEQFIVSNVYGIEEAEELAARMNQRLYLKITKEKKEKETLQAVYRILKKYKGETAVWVHYEDEHRTIQLLKDRWVNPTEACIAELKTVLGSENVVLKRI